MKFHAAFLQKRLLSKNVRNKITNRCDEVGNLLKYCIPNPCYHHLHVHLLLVRVKIKLMEREREEKTKNYRRKTKRKGFRCCLTSLTVGRRRDE